MANLTSGIAIVAVVLSSIAIILVVVLYFLPRPVINDSEASTNRTYSSSKINTLIKQLQDQIDKINEQLKDKASVKSVEDTNVRIDNLGQTAGDQIWTKHQKDITDTVTNNLIAGPDSTTFQNNVAGKVAVIPSFQNDVASNPTLATNVAGKINIGQQINDYLSKNIVPKITATDLTVSNGSFSLGGVKYSKINFVRFGTDNTPGIKVSGGGGDSNPIPKQTGTWTRIIATDNSVSGGSTGRSVSYVGVGGNNFYGNFSTSNTDDWKKF